MHSITSRAMSQPRSRPYKMQQQKLLVTRAFQQGGSSVVCACVPRSKRFFKRVLDFCRNRYVRTFDLEPHYTTPICARQLCVKAIPNRQVFQNELQILRHVQHIPHTVRLMGSNTRAAELLLTREKDDLVGFLRASHLDRRTIFWRVLLHIGDTLQRCHELGIIHGDVKPSNILAGGVVPDTAPEFMLTDFGFSVTHEELNEEWYSARFLMNTPKYAAPETFTQRTVLHPEMVDWWGIGITLSIIICGWAPMTISHAYNGTVHLIVQKYIREYKHAFPLECDIVLALLAPDPKKRLGLDYVCFSAPERVVRSTIRYEIERARERAYVNPTTPMFPFPSIHTITYSDSSDTSSSSDIYSSSTSVHRQDTLRSAALQEIAETVARRKRKKDCPRKYTV